MGMRMQCCDDMETCTLAIEGREVILWRGKGSMDEVHGHYEALAFARVKVHTGLERWVAYEQVIVNTVLRVRPHVSLASS